MTRRVGVLALQGAFAEHLAALSRLGVEGFEIRSPGDLAGGMDGLVLPGGESTVMGKLMAELGLLLPLRAAVASGTPVLGTCAGLILLAKQAEGRTRPALATMDVTAVRNAFGRQLGSFAARGVFAGRETDMVFIRAPYIREWGPGVEPLARVDGRVVAARQGNMLATAFHPELTGEETVYRYFLEMGRFKAN